MFIKCQKGQKGFTLIELMIVIAIVAILAAIAIPQFSLYRMSSYNASAKSDLKNVYTSSQAYFSDYPQGTFDSSQWATYPFRRTPNVDVNITNGSINGLSITAQYSVTGATLYTIDSIGSISPWP